MNAVTTDSPSIVELDARIDFRTALAPLLDEPYPFILESRLASPRQGRYSFAGANPFAIVSGTRGDFAFRPLRGPAPEIRDPDFFALLKKVLARYRVAAKSPLPFVSGAVGYLGYDLRFCAEKFACPPARAGRVPDAILCLYDLAVVRDHRRGKTLIVGRDVPEPGGSVGPRIAALAEKIRAARPPAPPAPVRVGKPAWHPDRTEHLRRVAKTLAYIAAGDIYQANIARRLECPIDAADLDAYTLLAAANPSDFAALLRYPDFSVISTSPERFVKMRDRRVSTRPIKGTAPRGANPADDRRNAAGLLASAKDRAELAMIVDLLRNDLGRVARTGTVHVTEPCVLETYRSVHHLVATVRCELAPGMDEADLLRAIFPGGSITGAPKIRAMQIIDELERTARDVYTGAIGYIDFSGDLDFNIAIRTALLKNNTLYIDFGGGIVADSDPRAEFEETTHKAAAMLNALGVRAE